MDYFKLVFNNIKILSCGCGRKKEDHTEEAKLNANKEPFKSLKQWTVDACTENGDITDAFGDMLFLGGNDQIAKVGLKSC